ncbi:CinA family protein [Candidatus Desantisbacteria bacterium]|nr:CinA family protein [Candidatus Desantisbacteria bacterium]
MDIEMEIGRLLTIKGLTLSIAESCTGGMICSRITDVPGSSMYFAGGVIAYSNKIKVQMLGVKQEALDAHGAVSAQIAIEMAKGVRERYETNIGLAVTGIAGPGGGSLQKPVGLVYLSLEPPTGETICKKCKFIGERKDIRIQSTQVMLEMLLEYLTG